MREGSLRREGIAVACAGPAPLDRPATPDGTVARRVIWWVGCRIAPMGCGAQAGPPPTVAGHAVWPIGGPVGYRDRRRALSVSPETAAKCLRQLLEATSGIEPEYTVLQTVA
jgi:hypothetical protein